MTPAPVTLSASDATVTAFHSGKTESRDSGNGSGSESGRGSGSGSGKTTLPSSASESISTATAAALALSVSTPRTEYALRQANHLVERICQDNGVEAPTFSFARNMANQQERVVEWSVAKHESCVRVADYLTRRAQIEQDYAQSLQKLNRIVIQSGDSDERMGQMVIMTEKTAAGHADLAKKIVGERLSEELKTLCVTNEAQRKYLLAEIKLLRGTWSKAVGGFEKMRKNRDKAMRTADAAKVALDQFQARNPKGSKSQLERLREDHAEKGKRALVVREEYAAALAALETRQQEIFREHLPRCFAGLERLERTRIASLRTALLSVAQSHVALADLELESGDRWLKSLVAVSVDEELESFIKSHRDERDAFDLPELESEGEKEGEGACRLGERDVACRLGNDDSAHAPEDKNYSPQSPQQTHQTQEGTGSLYEHLTRSESNLLQVSSPRTSHGDSPANLPVEEWRRRRIQLLQLLDKLGQQQQALEKMEQAYREHGDAASTDSTFVAIQSNIQGIISEQNQSRLLLAQIEQRLARLGDSAEEEEYVVPLGDGMSATPVDKMAQIMEEFRRMEESRQQAHISARPIQPVPAKPPAKEKKKALSRSFEDVLQADDLGDAIDNVDDLIDEMRGSVIDTRTSVQTQQTQIQTPTPTQTQTQAQATQLKLPGAQWTDSTVSRSNSFCTDGDVGFFGADEEVAPSDTRCADGDVALVDELVSDRRRFRSRLTSLESAVSESEPAHGAETVSSPGRRRSAGQSTPAITATKTRAPASVPLHNTPLFRVQSLYNFSGRKETDELDLRTGEILTVFDAEGEWWEGENEAGVRGYIPFNYVIRIS